jgi:hypothetical protein
MKGFFLSTQLSGIGGVGEAFRRAAAGQATTVSVAAGRVPILGGVIDGGTSLAFA